MVTVHNPRLLYNAIITRLATQTEKSVGDAVRPDNPSNPYAVVYPLPDRATLGTLTDPNAISLQLFQVTCVGTDMDEAQWMQNRVRSALLGWTPTLVGFTANRIELDLGSGVLRDDDGPVFYTTDRFSLYVE